jgi:hypothetical protein
LVLPLPPNLVSKTTVLEAELKAANDNIEDLSHQL